jgi:hypothetical protein
LALPGDNLYCTRIDVQMSIERPKDYDPLAFYELSTRTARSMITTHWLSTSCLRGQPGRLSSILKRPRFTWEHATQTCL